MPEATRRPSIGSPQMQTMPASCKRILVVDDCVVTRKLAHRMFTSLGFEVEQAVNGREALEMLINRSYVVVLMDFTMPVIMIESAY